MQNQISESVMANLQNCAVLAYSNGVNLSTVLTSFGKKNELVKHLVLRSESGTLSEVTTQTILEKPIFDASQPLSLFNGNLHLQYVESFRCNALIIGNNALCVPAKWRSDAKAEKAHDNLLFNMFLALALPQSIVFDAQSVAKRVFELCPTFPIPKNYAKMSRYLGEKVSFEFDKLVSSFVPVKHEVLFFDFPKVESVKTEKAVKTPKVEKVETITEAKAPTAREKATALHTDAIAKTAPKSRKTVAAIDALEYCKQQYEKSGVKTKFATWLNTTFDALLEVV